MTEFLSLPSTSPWLRLPPAPYERIVSRLGGWPVALWPVAIDAMGRAVPDSPLYHEVPADVWRPRTGMGTQLLPLVVHAGPEAGAHTKERPIGPEAIANSRHGRTPRPLDAGDWDEISERYAAAARHLRECGADTLVLSIDDDGLLASALSPRTHPSKNLAERVEIVLKVLSAVQTSGIQVVASLTVEELCPHGLDATDGIQTAQELVAAGVHAIIASGGTRSLEPLRSRDAATIEDDPCVASALWLVGRTSVPIWAQGPAPTPERTHRRAQEQGLAGVVAMDFSLP